MPATAADKQHRGWHMRRHFWTPDVRAKVEPLVRANARMARYAARKAKRRFPAADYDDLLSEAMYALARCAASYDPARGASFATYAIRTICRTTRDRARVFATRRARRVSTVPMLPGDGAEPGGGLADLATREDAAWAMERIRELPPRERLVVELRLAGTRFAAIVRHPGVAPMTTQRACNLFRSNMTMLRHGLRMREAG